MGFHQDICSWLWNHNGAAIVYTSCLPGMVSICFWIPDAYALQSSFQQRSADSPYSRRAQGRQIVKQWVVQGARSQLWSSWFGQISIVSYRVNYLCQVVPLSPFCRLEFGCSDQIYLLSFPIQLLPSCTVLVCSSDSIFSSLVLLILGSFHWKMVDMLNG